MQAIWCPSTIYYTSGHEGIGKISEREKGKISSFASRQMEVVTHGLSQRGSIFTSHSKNRCRWKVLKESFHAAAWWWWKARGENFGEQNAGTGRQNGQVLAFYPPDERRLKCIPSKNGCCMLLHICFNINWIDMHARLLSIQLYWWHWNLPRWPTVVFSLRWWLLLLFPT